MSHNPFETEAKDYVKKIAEKGTEAFRDNVVDDAEKKEIQQQAEAIRKFLEGGKEKDPDDKKAREDALYKAIMQITKENPDISIREICDWIFGDIARDFFKYELKEMLTQKDKFSPVLVRLYLFYYATEDPDTIIKNIEKLHFPYTGEILERAVVSATEKDPEIAFEYIGNNAHLSYAKWVMEQAAWVAAEKYPDVAFKYVDLYKNQPYAKPVIEKAVRTALKQDPYALLEYVDSYKDLSYKEWIIEQAAFSVAEQNPEAAFKFAESYKDKPYAGKVIEIAVRTAVERKPSVVLEYVDSYKDLSYKEWAIERAAWVAAKKYPGTAFTYADRYKNQPYAKEVIEKAARTAAEKDPIIAFLGIDLYKNQPYAKEVIEKAARTAAEKDTDAVFQHAYLYKNQPYAKEVMITAAQNNPQSAFSYVDNYKDQPYAKEVLLIAADLDPWDFVESSDRFVNCFAPAEWKPLLDRCKGYVDLVEKRGIKNLPSQIIQRSDFPFDREVLRFSILKADRKPAAIFGFNESTLIPSDIRFRDFEKIFFSEPAQNFFKLHAGKFTYMNAISVCKVIYRKLCKEGKAINDETIQEALAAIAEEREKVSRRELFGPHTKLIIFAHEEKRFDTDKIIQTIWKRSGGKEEDVVANEKGMYMEGKVNKRKERVLQAIREIKSPTTILFEGHGSPENWAFARNTADDLDRSLAPSPTTINYKELGDALIASGHIADVNLIGDTCLAYNFLMNLFQYIESKGVKEKPYVSISTANKEQLAWGIGHRLDSRLLEAFFKVSKEDEPVTVGHFFKAESLLWEFEDPALFVGRIGGVAGQSPPSKNASQPAREQHSEPSDISREVQSLPQTPSQQQESSPKHFLEISEDYKFSKIERLV
ncbi:hypothetical protein HZC21_01300 [Candidatus Peregrinibacteria bacterium]|nr:hypothetical protein [Candidatus Peregrinibacteria bacterium]